MSHLIPVRYTHASSDSFSNVITSLFSKKGAISRSLRCLRSCCTTDLCQQHKHPDDYHDTNHSWYQSEHGRRCGAPIGGRLGCDYLVSDTNRDCAEQAGDKCVYDCISNGVLTSSIYFRSGLFLAGHLTIRSCLSSNALSVRLSVCLSLCFRIGWRHLWPRSTNYSRCTSCGFDSLTSRLGVRKSFCLLISGQITIPFLSYCTNLLLDSNYKLSCNSIIIVYYLMR